MGLAGMLLDGFLGLGGGGEDGEVGIVDLWELTERQGIDAAAHFNGVPGRRNCWMNQSLKPAKAEL